MTLSLTLYAVTTKSDFTMMGATFFIFACALFMFGLILMFFHNYYLHILYCSLGIILYGYYLVYDI